MLLDTNVVVRATGNATGPARELFLRLLGPPHQLIGSAFLFDELRRVLNYPRVQALHGLTVDEAERHVSDLGLPPSGRRLRACQPRSQEFTKWMGSV